MRKCHVVLLLQEVVPCTRLPAGIPVTWGSE